MDPSATPAYAESYANRVAALLDECEAVIQQYAYDMEFGVSGDSVARRGALAKATLAKLRGAK